MPYEWTSCQATYESCMCMLHAGHESESAVHQCSCHGAWTGDDRKGTPMVPIRWPLTGISTGLGPTI